MKLKASSINNLTDARYFAAWNAEWLGFCLEQGHPNYASPQDIQEIKDWLVGPKIVGEFGLGQTAQEIQAAINLLNLDAIQLSMFANDTIATEINSVPVIKEYVVQNLASIAICLEKCQELDKSVDFFLLDFAANGINWTMIQQDATALELLQKICATFQIIISIDCPPTALATFIDLVQPYGWSVKGGEEEKVGVRSFDDLDDFFEVLEDMDLIGF